MSDLTALRQRHDELHRRVLDAVVSDDGLAEGERDELVGEMDRLLTDLNAVANGEMTADTYEWLSTALLNWQVASTTLLEAPREIQMPRPSGDLQVSRRRRVWSDDEVQRWLGDTAWELSKIRRARDLIERVDRIAAQASSEQEQAGDWLSARALFAYQLLAGELSLTDQLTARSFLHIKDVWLDHVKKVWAYMRWRERGSPLSGDGDDDYLAACAELNRQLSSSSTKKATPVEFSEAEEFLRQEFLLDGRVAILEPTQAESGDLRRREHSMWRLVRSKAERRAQLTDEHDAMENWRQAERQVRDFYENVIEAVQQGDPASTRTVLGALSGDNERIATALEAALAVYFVDPSAAAS